MPTLYERLATPEEYGENKIRTFHFIAIMQLLHDGDITAQQAIDELSLTDADGQNQIVDATAIYNAAVAASNKWLFFFTLENKLLAAEMGNVFPSIFTEANFLAWINS